MTSGLFGGLFARGPVAAQVSDRAYVRAMVDAEVALAHGLVSAGLAPAGTAEQIAAAADAAFDLDRLGHGAGEEGTPVPALLGALRERLPEAAADQLHRGATSQDIIDTAAMLVTRRALAPLVSDLGHSAATCAALAERHRHSVMAGRTLLQQAAPVTFGLKAAGWLTALDRVRRELTRVREHELLLQLGGAVGTLASLGDRGPAVAAEMASRLGLTTPAVPWHSDRVAPARIAASLGLACGAMAKVARDVTLLAQTELGELREGGERGASSAMPHKHNPVRAIAVLACASRAPGLSSTIQAAMAQEHERGAGGWQAEWETLAELLRLAGSAAASLAEMLDGLQIDTERMRANIDELSMSESVMVALAEGIGRTAARAVVEQAAERAARGATSFRESLLQAPEVRDGLGAHRLDLALDPERYLGATRELIDRAIGAWSVPESKEDP